MDNEKETKMRKHHKEPEDGLDVYLNWIIVGGLALIAVMVLGNLIINILS